MSTKINTFAESLAVGFIEAAWLAAVILTPLFFNIYSSRIFEPEKIVILRSLAVLILACWLIEWIEKSGSWRELFKTPAGDWQTWLRQPLVLPVVALALGTSLSTLLSVTPSASLWGSYPRLQGAYTIFSYLIIFAAMLVHIRRREQVDRLIGAIIIASLPVSLYGILQHYGLDPIPWGGDVTQRIASNLGNSIFVAAYLIMVFPLTIMRIVEAFEDLLKDEGSPLANFVRATCYVFIAALQVIAMYFSGSRGPWLGWGVSLIVIWLGLSLIWRKRWLTGAGVALALLAGAFLVLLNIAGGPLEGLRNQPGFGRLGQLLDADSRTGKVRTLIWQGASELVTPHEPLEYPDGEQDVWNALRPVIGYGPEAMYVAYNRFYPPELSLVEKRNASPDRAHNETWDVLVATGLVGLLAYLSLFGSLIYYALKWLGLIRNKRQRNLFLSFSFLGGAVSTVVFVAWQGVAYFGVALPFGMLLGMIAYLLLSSMAGWFEPVTTSAGRLRAYLLLGFFAAIVAHFMEINFGIAISVTRLYFWVYAALIILLGYRLPQLVVFQDAQNISEVSDYRAGTARNPDARFRPVMTKRRKEGSAAAVRRKGRTLQASERNWVFSEFTQNMIVLALVLAILMATLGYNFLTNNQRFLSSWTVIWVSLTRIKSADYPSYGLLALVITTWLVGGAVLAAEQQRRRLDEQQNFWKLWLGVLTISMLAAGSYWLIQASNLVALAKSTASSLEDVLRQVHMSENLLGVFNFFMLALLTILAFVFAYRQTVRLKVSRFFAGLPGLAVLLLTLIFASYSNLRIVQADVAFKAAELFTQPKSWPVAIAIYQRAIQLAPKEDYYYLFLGRAYLESAKLIADPEESDALISQAAADLRTAQALNPLNTDHTANLARLYSVWANSASDPILQDERAAISEAYFEQALKLSPNNARLWNEWAMLYLNILSQPEKAYERIKTALALDPSYDWSYALLGDYYGSLAAQTSGAQARVEALQNAAAAYQNALQRAGPESSSLRFNYALALGSIQMQLGQLEAADQSLSLALNLAQPEEKWRAFEALAFNAHQKGELAKAREYASQALEAAPEAAKDRLRQSLDRLSD